MSPSKPSRKGRPTRPSPKGRLTTSEPLVRRVQVSGCRTRVAVNVDTPWLEPPSLESTSRLEIRGTMDEAIQSVGDVVIKVYPSEMPVSLGPTQTPSVGDIVEIRPQVIVLWCRCPHPNSTTHGRWHSRGGSDTRTLSARSRATTTHR